MKTILAPVALLGVVAFLAHSAATAHPSFETRQARVGAPYKAVIRIVHGCDGSPTTKVRVVIPEGVIGVKPMPRAGWSIEIKTRPYERAYNFFHGAVLKEGVREIIWTGNLPDAYYDELIFSAFLTDSLAAGTTLYFPIYQDCEHGSYAWNEVPAPGQDSHALKTPAPGIALLPVADKTAPASIFKIGALVIDAPWMRATPGGAKVAGGYLKVTNTGKEADRLIGGSLPIAKRVEVHEMAVAGKVMKMRHLSDGLEIKPGETVELKPGGNHLMFLELSTGLKAGEPVKGTLVFQKAGTLEVEFSVAPIGAQSNTGGGHMHHQ
jgi:periplasmic copper chaperone A